MKAVILAAGYATRLYPLTLDRPKALLPVGGRPMVEHLLEQLDGSRRARRDLPGHELEVRRRLPRLGGRVGAATRCEIVDDGTADEETKLGAIGDLELTIRQRRRSTTTCSCSPGDNLFSESLAPFARVRARPKRAPALGVYDVGDLEAIRRYNAIELDEDDRLTFFEEKPEHAAQHADRDRALLLPARVARARARVPRGGEQPRPARPAGPSGSTRGSRSTPGVVPGRWYDIGSAETLAEADQAFSTGG